MITSRQIQEFVGVPPDGKYGKVTEAAIRLKLIPLEPEAAKWPRKRLVIGIQQVMLAKDYTGKLDGYAGPAFEAALEARHSFEVIRDAAGEVPETKSAVKPIWPRQKDVPAFYGAVGQNQTMLELPFPMKLAWDLKTTVHRMSLHKKVAASAGRAYAAVLKEYGADQIKELRLDRWGGSLNVRKMRSGNSYSMHSWGIAIDTDPDRNGFHDNHTKAAFAKPIYDPWFKAWADEGWISLGKERDFDWMHIQAARL